VGGQHHAPVALPPGKTRYPLCRRLGGPQGPSGLARKNSPSLGFDPRIVQPVASPYIDWAIPAPNNSHNNNNNNNSSRKIITSQQSHAYASDAVHFQRVRGSGLSFTEIPSDYTRSSCVCPLSHTDICILPSAPAALSLSSSHCRWRRLLGDDNVRSVGELKADWNPYCVHCRPGQSETQSHVTIYVSLSTTCVKVLKKIQKSVHVPGAICLKHRYSYFAPYVNISKYSSWTVKNT